MIRDRSNACFACCIPNIIRGIHLCSRGLLRHLKQRNVTTIMWVANHQDEFQELRNQFDDELMGVMTDRPSELRTFSHGGYRI